MLSAHFWLYFLIPGIITDAETDNIDENPLFDDENQHVLEIYQLLMWTIPFLEKLKKLKELATELLKIWEKRKKKKKKFSKLQLLRYLVLSMKSTIKILFSMELC